MLKEHAEQSTFLERDQEVMELLGMGGGRNHNMEVPLNWGQGFGESRVWDPKEEVECVISSTREEVENVIYVIKNWLLLVWELEKKNKKHVKHLGVVFKRSGEIIKIA